LLDNGAFSFSVVLLGRSTGIVIQTLEAFIDCSSMTTNACSNSR